MAKIIAVLALAACAGVVLFAGWQRGWADSATEKMSGAERLEYARRRSGAKIRERFLAAGIDRPRLVFLRAFKKEGELELWALGGGAKQFKLIATFPVLAASGKPGPKRREGDRQVPEGFYRIDRFNPQSAYHLSLGIDYPNASDRVRSDPQHPGSDIFVHGKDVTIGCLPLGDEGIEQLYLALEDAQRSWKAKLEIPVHIFPARMGGETWESFRREQVESAPELAAFWAELQPGYDAFEKTRVVPLVSTGADGAYKVEERTAAPLGPRFD
ncbi:MAG TPA: L,D-transpeptidase family protein [Chthoniobacteraceae bacterium]|jgi:murein L,D-transpeptidase YafK